MELRDRVVVVTGASSGVGRALALELAHRGAHVVLAARRRDALEEIAGRCRRLRVEAVVVPADVTHEEDVARIVEAAMAVRGRIDAWVNNAGVTLYAQLEEGALEDHARVLETNLMGAIVCARAVMPVFREQKQGVLVNVGSVLSHVGQAFVPAYVISKFGVRGLSEALRVEIADQPDIHVCTVFPYAIDTPHFEVAASKIGRAPFALPPVQSPEKVARAIAEVCERPRRVRYVPRFLALGVAMHAIAPRTTEHLLLDALRRWHLSDEPQAIGPGNLYAGSKQRAMTHGHRPPKIGVLGLGTWIAGRFVANGAESLAKRLGPLAQRALRSLVRLQLRASVAAVGLAARTLAKQVDHDDSRVRLAAKAARWYVRRGNRELATEGR